ncbi:MAG TPA: type II secretion system protein [Candidatus Saccharimonadales bacterium]|nr:type II secretion system protein [Candidatus Saccharimonadales bacterium]
MHSLNRQKGFTIVELLIVIVVIGILATLVIVTFTGIQQKARNTKRNTDINALQSHVEAFYAQNGFYPSRTNMNDATWRSTNVKGLDPDALKDPKGSAQTLVATAAANSYAYAPLNDSNASCEADQTTCSKYTLTATLEGGGTYAKQSN